MKEEEEKNDLQNIFLFRIRIIITNLLKDKLKGFIDPFKNKNLDPFPFIHSFDLELKIRYFLLSICTIGF